MAPSPHRPSLDTCHARTRTTTDLGHRIASSTVCQILKASSIDPAPERSYVTWSQSLHSQTALASGFFTVDTALLSTSIHLSRAVDQVPRLIVISES